MVLALPELLALAGLILALGMVTMGDAFTRALFQVTEAGVGWIPWIGKKAANGVHAVSKRVNSVFSAAALRLQGAISDSWHVLAYLVEQTGQAIWEATEVGAKALWYVEVKYPLAGLSWLAHRAGGQVVHLTKVAGSTTKNYYTQVGVTKAQFRDLVRKYAVLSAKIAAFPVLGAGAIALPFPRIGALERAGHATKSRLSRLERRFGRKAFAAAVATALATLGISWTRKACAKRTADGFCRVDPDVFAGLISGLILIYSSISLLDLARGMQEITDESVEAARAFIREATAADAMPSPAKGLDAFNTSTQV